MLGVITALKGNLKTARTHLEVADRLSPRDPTAAEGLVGYNMAAFAAGEYEDVIDNATKSIRLNPEYPAPYRQRAAALAMVERLDDARKDIERVLELIPGNTIEEVREQASYFPNLDRFLEGLRRAGLPEE